MARWRVGWRWVSTHWRSGVDVEGHEAAEDSKLFAAKRQGSFVEVGRQDELGIEFIENVKFRLDIGLENTASHRRFDGAR